LITYYFYLHPQNYEGKTSRELLAEKSPDSHEQIRKYIRLTELIPEVLNLVDEGKIAMRPAVELSYLPPESQEALLEEAIESEDCTPNH
jgi:ParB family chromosome partitioning protein